MTQSYRDLMSQPAATYDTPQLCGVFSFLREKDMSNKKRFFASIIILVFAYAVFTSFNVGKIIAKTADYADIDAYNGSVAVVVNNNKPIFSYMDISTESYEKYGELDSLGRATSAIACVGTDIMPTEERSSIGSVKPTGWEQNKYPGIVDSDPPYLYNRCHIIGSQLTGENANERNLITGTRYMNAEGMLPYENQIAEYVKSTENHVVYRVTPVYEGDNLLCTGVQMEACSVEDGGKGVSFNVFVYNVQPGVVINYADGTNELAEGYTLSEDLSDEEIESEPATEGSYVANKNTKKFHLDTCDSVHEMKESNKLYFEGYREDLIEQGYIPCKRCNP